MSALLGLLVNGDSSSRKRVCSAGTQRFVDLIYYRAVSFP